MKPVGEVVRTSGGIAVVRSPDEGHPGIGASVVDDQLTAVGRVVDVFGPVDRPYVAISTDDGVHVPTLVGRRLYQRDG